MRSPLHPPRPGPRARQRHSWLSLLLLGGIAVAGLIAGCSDGPTVPPRAVAPTLRASAAAEGATTAPGLGGSYFMSAGGEAIMALPMAPTGIRLPAGVPVRVRVSGEITRTATPGLREFCSLEQWKETCESVWAEIVAETPIPPSGPAFHEGAGAALVAWDGGEGTSPPEGSSVALSGPSGAELWAGRSNWGCYYVDIRHNLQGPCFTFGGGYTVTVEADDGRRPDSAGGGGGGPDSTALLGLTILQSDVGPEGGTVELLALARGGAVIKDARWYFIPDSIGAINGDTTAPPPPDSAAVARKVASSASAERRAPSGLRQVGEALWQLPDGRVVGPGLYLVRTPRGATVSSSRGGGTRVPAVAAGSTATAFQAIASCDELTTCVAQVTQPTGSFLVVAQVNGQLLSASARLGDTPPDDEEPRLNVSCTSGMTRGATVKCTAALSPAVPFDVVIAEATLPDGGSTFASGTASPDRKAWVSEGPAVVSTDLSVMVMYQQRGEPRTATGRTRFQVATRGWTTPEPTELPKEEPAALLYYQVFKFIEAGLFVPPKPAPIQPTDIVEVTEGPNRGLTYLAHPPDLERPVARINQFILPGTDFYRAQNGRGPEGRFTADGYPYCDQAGIDRYLQEARRHEGITGAEDSHFGLWRRQVQRENLNAYFERLYFRNGIGAEAIRKRLLDVIEKEFFPVVEWEHKQFDFDEYGTPEKQRALRGGCEFNWDF